MKKKIYKLEYTTVYYKDSFDNEDVEERYIIGFFSNELLLIEAMNICKFEGMNKDCLQITEYELDCWYDKKYVYVLFYEYSRISNGIQWDYYYSFPPQPNKIKCILQKKSLLNDFNYKNSADKIYYDSKDGFRIKRVLLNFVETENRMVNLNDWTERQSI